MALLASNGTTMGGALSGNKSAVIEAVNTAAGIVKFYTDSFIWLVKLLRKVTAF